MNALKLQNIINNNKIYMFKNYFNKIYIYINWENIINIYCNLHVLIATVYIYINILSNILIIEK